MSRSPRPRGSVLRNRGEVLEGRPAYGPVAGARTRSGSPGARVAAAGAEDRPADDRPADDWPADDPPADDPAADDPPADDPPAEDRPADARPADDRPTHDLVPRPGSTLVSRRVRLRGTVYLLLDTSASMSDGDKMSQLFRGSVRFFYEAWRRRYAVGVIAFDRGARVLSGATRDPHRFQRSLAGLEPGGGTAMAAALRLALWRLRFRRGRRVALLITDGKPDSREDALDAAARARALGVTVLAVGTDPADEAFLRALVPRPELAVRVAPDDLAGGIGRSAGALPDD